MSIAEAITPLRMIFWGALLCVLDLSINTSGFRFDLLNDFLGMLLVTVAVANLSGFEVDPFFRSSMQFVFFCSVLGTIEAFLGHFVFQRPLLLNVLSNLLGLALLVATVLFCTCMQRLSSALSLHQSADSWLTSRFLVIVLWVVPLGLLYLGGLAATVTGKEHHWDVGLVIIPLLVVLLIPLIHLFISTSRMQHEAESPSP